jgi:hypothetical protein
MKKRLMFYCFILAMIVLDSVLLRSPSLLGKIGLIIYKYSYLRTFPKALLTVSLVVGIAVVVAETIRILVVNGKIKKITGSFLLIFFLLASISMLIKTGIDFTAWSYSHTGYRFRFGAYLLPFIWMVVFGYHFFTLPSRPSPVITNDGISDT